MLKLEHETSFSFKDAFNFSLIVSFTWIMSLFSSFCDFFSIMGLKHFEECHRSCNYNDWVQFNLRPISPLKKHFFTLEEIWGLKWAL